MISFNLSLCSLPLCGDRVSNTSEIKRAWSFKIAVALRAKAQMLIYSNERKTVVVPQTSQLYIIVVKCTIHVTVIACNFRLRVPILPVTNLILLAGLISEGCVLGLATRKTCRWRHTHTHSHTERERESAPSLRPRVGSSPCHDRSGIPFRMDASWVPGVIAT